MFHALHNRPVSSECIQPLSSMVIQDMPFNLFCDLIRELCINIDTLRGTKTLDNTQKTDPSSRSLTYDCQGQIRMGIIFSSDQSDYETVVKPIIENIITKWMEYGTIISWKPEYNTYLESMQQYIKDTMFIYPADNRHTAPGPFFDDMRSKIEAI